MNRSHKRALLRTACILAVGVSTTPAWAQPVQEPAARSTQAESGLLDEVVVTARRREENIQDIPIAVSAFSTEALEEKQIKSTQDLSKLAPGLQLSASGGVRDAFTPYIRGQGATSGTGQASVVPYFAEVPNFNASYYDLANLQVIKGAQGTLFGETATGGVLLYTPRKPTNDLGGYVRASIGNYDYREVEGAVGGPIIEDRLMVRLAGIIRQRQGFTTAYSSVGAPPALFDGVDRAEFRASVVFKPWENLELYGVYAYNDIKSEGQSQLAYKVLNKVPTPNLLVPSATAQSSALFEYFGGRAPPAGRTWQQLIEDATARQLALGPRATTVNYDHNRQTKFNGFVGQAIWTISDTLTLKNIYGIYWTKIRGPLLETDAMDLPLVDSRAPEFIPGISPSDGFLPGAKNWSNETQVLGTLLDNKLSWQAGFYFRRNPATYWNAPQGTIIVFGAPQGLPAPAATCAGLGVAPPCGVMTRSFSESYAVYGQATYAVTDRINVTGGFRRTTDYRRSDTTAGAVYFREFRGVQVPLSVAGTQPLPGARITSLEVPRESFNTYTLAADWNFADDWLVYATQRTGYKGGGINATAPQNDPSRSFGPERVKDIELGLKGRFDLGGVGILSNIAAYRTEYQDIQRNTLLLGTATTVTQNLAAATIQGIEVELKVQPSRYFDVNGFFAYTDAGFDEWVENTRCSSQPYQAVCAGLPGATALTVDHANGKAMAAGRTSSFEPDILAETSEYRYGIQPALHLGFINEALSTATLSANIYYRSSSTSTDLNNSAGTNGANILPGYTLADARFDWRNVMGSQFSLFASVTNLEDKTFPIFIGDATNICNCIHAIYSEPRFWSAGFTYTFGGG